MLSFQTVFPHTLELLRQLTAEPLFAELRLVGGTSLALQYGHRRSVDLDFFGYFEDDSDAFRERLEALGSLVPHQEGKIIKTYELDGVKIDFVNYSRYPWIDDPVLEDGLRLASPKDIAAMKINAIEGRGSRKDFIDLFFLLRHYSLEDILCFYQQKFGVRDLFRALMSLTYFADAEQQMMPEMYADVSWEEMKSAIIAEVKRVSPR